MNALARRSPEWLRRSIRRRRVAAVSPTSHREVRRLHHLPRGVWLHGERVIGLTFDDGPYPDRTSDLLATLEALDVPATFFLIGRRVDRAPAVARRLLDEGHLVANHAYSHKNLTELSPGRAFQEIVAGKASISHHTGHEPLFFRPPFSARDDRLRRTVGEAGQILVDWSVSVNDGRSTTEEIVEGVTRGFEPGAIILLHELPQTIRALPEIVARARALGYRFVTLDGSGERHGLRRADTSARRIASVTPDHTAGLVTDRAQTSGHAFLCRAEDAEAVAYTVWAASWQRAALLLISGDDLPAPYWMQIERLRPAMLVRVGDALGFLEEHEALPMPGIDRPDARQLLSDIEVTSGRWLLTSADDPCTMLATAATAGRIGAGLLVLDGDPARAIEALQQQAPTDVTIVGLVDPDIREALAMGSWSMEWLDGTGPVELAACLARAYPPAAPAWLTPPRYEPDVVAAAVAAGSRGAAIIFVDEGATVAVYDILASTAAAGPPLVVGDTEAISDAAIWAAIGLDRRIVHRWIRR